MEQWPGVNRVHRGISTHMATKGNRCWPGYEPVKGKKQHEQGICRKKSKAKLTSSEQKFRKKRQAQLDRWEKAHPSKKRKAAQHLHSPGERATQRASASGARHSSSAKRSRATNRRSTAKRGSSVKTRTAEAGATKSARRTSARRTTVKRGTKRARRGVLAKR